MSRLADYFLVVGYDKDKEGPGGHSCGKILQRFPEVDWPDISFNEGITLFCQPQGWFLSQEEKEPQFFMAVLTDIDGNRHYCATLSFFEPVSVIPVKHADEEEDGLENNSLTYTPLSLSQSTLPASFHSLMYAPKCLVLVSRHNLSNTLQNCLGILYTAYIECLNVQLEILIGNILGCVQVPPPGGPQVRFSIGAGDRQAIQPPIWSGFPITGNCIAQLMQLLGPYNSLCVFAAALTEHKIILCSKSYKILKDSCQAIIALMFPFRYTHVYIPILPSCLLEVCSTPTPFIIGIHSSLWHEVIDFVDIVLANLDEGRLIIPDGLLVPDLPDGLKQCVEEELLLILRPELATYDLAFSVHTSDQMNIDILDKQIHAVFLRFFARLFQGYRRCLNVVRIHPSLVLTFCQKGLIGCEFTKRLLDCMFFTTFVQEKGSPWRFCDIWDELYIGISEWLTQEMANTNLILNHIQDLAQQLYLNEHPNPEPYSQRVLQPHEGTHSRIHQLPFPVLDSNRIQQIIDEGLIKEGIRSRLTVSHPMPRLIPLGAYPLPIKGCKALFMNPGRRLEVLKNCITFIFDGHIADARKILPAVLHTFRSNEARISLCNELNQHVIGNKIVLDHQQFDLITKLMNKALQEDSFLDEFAVANSLVPLSAAICRRLCPGVMQYAYTCIQMHSIWSNLSFWEELFYIRVQEEIKSLYLPQLNDFLELESVITSKKKDINTLEIVAEQIRLWKSLSHEQQQQMISLEESTLFTQVVHVTNWIIYLCVPLDSKASNKYSGDNSSISNSIEENEELDEESGFDEEEELPIIRFIRRFVDKVCTEGLVSEAHLRSLHQMIPSLVAVHTEQLETVYHESKRLPPIQKSKIFTPLLLPGEKLLNSPLRVYLIGDGREDVRFLPAEGALFISNYRIVFKGAPIDTLVSDHIVIRSIPLLALTKEKRIPIHFLSQLDQWFPDGLQLRAACFQLLKLAFDSEVTADQIEALRKLLHRLRHPISILDTFAFCEKSIPPVPLSHIKKLSPTIKGFAKKTFLKTAKRAGFTTKGLNKHLKYMSSGRMTLPNLKSEEGTDYNGFEEELSAISVLGKEKFCFELILFKLDSLHFLINQSFVVADTLHPILRSQHANQIMAQVSEWSYCLDLVRLKLASQQNGSFHFCALNLSYGLCYSYPILISMPSSLSDDRIQRIAKLYRHGRLPVAVWRHSEHSSVLLRSAGLHLKGVIGMLKGHPGGSVGTSESSLAIEQEKLLSLLTTLAAASICSGKKILSSITDSCSSIDSLLMTAAEPGLITPESYRRSNTFVKAMNNFRDQTLRSSSGKPGTFYKNRDRSSESSLTSQGIRTWLESSDNVQSLRRCALYVFAERSQIRALRVDANISVDYIPVAEGVPDVRRVKTAFKKLMQSCIPHSVRTEIVAFRSLEESGWMTQLHGILHTVGAIVDLLDLQGSSVLLCLEDGWDLTSQLSSLAQLCLDPHYRTIQGFRTLIEKEWLSFGHKFAHRHSHNHNAQTSDFTPIFIQFLDCVHQIVCQFPSEFEFNQYYLCFLAFHSISGRFQTFLENSEAERLERILQTEEPIEKHRILGLPCDNVMADSDDLDKKIPNPYLMNSVFDYIMHQHARKPIFYNFLYFQRIEVLRPVIMMSTLQFWDFFIHEEMIHGSPYDLEIIAGDNQQYEQVAINQADFKHILSRGYDYLLSNEGNGCTELISEIRKWQSELGYTPTPWKAIWDELISPLQCGMLKKENNNIQFHQHCKRSAHKRATLELLVRGRLAGSDVPSIGQHPHNFEHYNFTTPSYCDFCSGLLWGVVKSGMRCSDCGYSCHDKCIKNVPANCTKYKIVPSGTLKAANTNNEEIQTKPGVPGVHEYYKQFTSNITETRTHEGYLLKKGALLKNWKQRWFVLDSMQHQLRYYDDASDGHCKGYIDLAEVISVCQQGIPSGLGKKMEEGAFFDLRTIRRTYNFWAASASAVHEWVEKIQACLQ